MNRSAFFASLGAPLVNARWSWGAVRPADGVVFLQVWRDRLTEVGGVTLVQLARRAGDDPPRKPGARERQAHVGLVRAGAVCYFVIGEAADPAARPRRVATFDADRVYRCGRLHLLDGAPWAEVGPALAVAAVAPAAAAPDAEPGAAADTGRISAFGGS